MADPTYTAMVSFWERARDSVLALAQRAWSELADDESQIWATGRDLNEDEGVGFQSELTDPGPFAGEVQEFRLVLQWEVVSGRTGLFWAAQATPGILLRDGSRVILKSYRWRIPFRQWRSMTELTLGQIVPTVREMIDQLHATGELPEEAWMGHTLSERSASPRLHADGDRQDESKPPNHY